MDEHAVDLESMLRALVDESVRSRLRHRALLSALESSGSLQIADYIRAYRAEEEKNFGPLLDILLMAPEAFKDKHGDWLEAERTKFGTSPSTTQGVRLTETLSVPKVLETADLGEPLKRSSKRKKRSLE